MKTLEYFLKPTQKELFGLLRKMYRGSTVVRKGQFILVPGEAPIMLLAHLDTVHEKPVHDICKTQNGNILMSPQGIGGDDRCGVYALVTAHEQAAVKPWLLFTCNEEVGGVGAYAFADEYSRGKLPKGLDELKLLVGIDRKGSKDAVYYDCDNPDFETYITSKGFVTAEGSFSDISAVAPALGVAAVNLSSGYYNAHTLHEYINRGQLNEVVAKVGTIIQDASDPAFPKYEYRERVWHGNAFGWGSWGGWDRDWYDDARGKSTKRVSLASKVIEGDSTTGAPKDLPSDLVEMYNELLELYSKSEIEQLRDQYGDGIIPQMYDAEYGPFYGNDSKTDLEDR